MLNEAKEELKNISLIQEEKINGKIDVMSEIDIEIEEYQEMITHAIQTNNKADLAMWRRALQTAKICKRRLANS